MFEFRRATVLALLMLTAAMLPALEVPPGGADISGGSALKAWAQPESGKVEELPAAGQRISITPAGEMKNYHAQFVMPCASAVAKDEVVLAIIKARVVGDVPVGDAHVKLQLEAAPRTSFAPTVGIAIPREWTELPVTFVANGPIEADKAAVVLLCGHKAQSIEVESIRVLKYPPTTDVAALPRIKRSYPGREADAPWRKAALERIEKQRKADLALVLTGADGRPLADAKVKVTLRRHEFGFGTAIPAKQIVGDTEDDKRTREIIDRLFSIVVFENDLKDGNWSPAFNEDRRRSRNTRLDSAFAWLAERHIAVRGHYLMQVATPFNLHAVTDAEAIRSSVLESVKERLAFVGDRVVEWDAINHPVAWSGADMLNKRPGLEQLDREVHTLARTLTKLPFFVNEDQVFRPGPQCDHTFDYIKALNAAGFTIEGLGNQAHFDESYLPSPEHLLAVTDRFAQIVPRQSVTEFDITTTHDEELAADYTRDALIACFSHPAYTSFLLWGFWEGAHWKPTAASWSNDWTLKPRGEVLEEWLGRRWRTEAVLKTDAAGRVTWRGFPGWYDVNVTGQTQAVSLTKAKPQGEVRL